MNIEAKLYRDLAEAENAMRKTLETLLDWARRDIRNLLAEIDQLRQYAGEPKENLIEYQERYGIIEDIRKKWAQEEED